MASGYGLTGGVSRCFPFWQEYLACSIINKGEDIVRDPKERSTCGPVLEDYYECLHHRKEAARARAIQKAYRKAEAAHPRDNAPKAGSIRSLGLIGKEDESKNILKITA